MKELTLGSLFDGIGGWQIAAVRAGIRPVWSSEIEKFPIEVTKKWFPETKQLGDITKIDGASIEPVDIICAGSPCQDLSIAGNRAGLAGERSGLFVKSIEIFRAMREATGGKQPRWFVWENVPGAFSSHQGQDFRTVLEQIGQASIPVPQSHKWAQAGMVRTETADICWRVLDAQYWGVPQRRKRIFLVADFGEQSRRCAGEVLFDAEGMCGNPAEGREPRKATSDAAQDSTPKTSLTPWDIQGRRIYDECGVSQILSGCDGGGGQRGSVNIFQHAKPLVQSEPQGDPIILKIRQPKIKDMGGNRPIWQEDMSYCLACHQNQTLFEATDYSNFRKAEVSRTISTGTEHKHLENIVVENTPKSAGFNIKASSKAGSVAYHDEVSCTVTTDGKAGEVQFENDVPRCIGIAENGRGEIRQTVGYHVSLTTGGGKPGEGYPCIQELSAEKKCFGASAFATFKESDVASTLKAQGGDLGGVRTLSCPKDNVAGILASGDKIAPTLCRNLGTHMFSSNQEAFSGGYFVIDKKKGEAAT